MDTGAGSYQKRCEWLLAKQLGVWDVYASCEREGSLDSRIRQPVVNNFAEVIRLCPALEVIAHNGAKSTVWFKRLAAASGVMAAPCRAGFECPPLHRS